MTDLVTIDLDEERMAVSRLYATWQRELTAKQQAVADACINHASPGPNYWDPEAKARAKYLVAANFVEMLEQARIR
jgi:hypothetical protein